MRFSAALDFVPVLAGPSEHSPPPAHHWDHDSDTYLGKVRLVFQQCHTIQHASKSD